MDKITGKKYTLGILFNKSNTWWNMDYFCNILKTYKNLNVKLIEANKDKIPEDLDMITLLPSDSDIIGEIINKNKNLFWVHCMWAGVDKFLSKKGIMENNNIILTNARGAYAESLAEYAIFSMLYFYFNAPIYLKGFKDRKWVRPLNKQINNKTLTIVGYGLNGIELAKKAKAGFDMKVYGIKNDLSNVKGKQYVDKVLNLESLDQILPESDFVVNLLPHTTETTNFYNSERFKIMKNTSIFINLGRGSSVIEEDLIKALKEKTIYAAVLDVFKVEPLPSDSPFYNLDNVLLSFHSCDNTDEYFQQGVDVFIKNFELFCNEGKFYSQVDKNKGY